MRASALIPLVGKKLELKTASGNTYKGTIESIDGDLVFLKKEDGKHVGLLMGSIRVFEEL